MDVDFDAVEEWRRGELDAWEAAEADPINSDWIIAHHLSDALIAILGQPWLTYEIDPGVHGAWCPSCNERIDRGEHLQDEEGDCAWLIAARACGVLP